MLGETSDNLKKIEKYGGGMRKSKIKKRTR